VPPLRGESLTPVRIRWHQDFAKLVGAVDSEALFAGRRRANRSNMPTIRTFLALLLFTGLAAPPVPQPPHTTKATAVGQRDKAMEGKVAVLFDKIRSDAHLSPLTRIRRRADLIEPLCTLAQTSRVPPLTKHNANLWYVTDHPEVASPELTQSALMKWANGPASPGSARYSVAVWRVNDPAMGKTTYWVIARQYMSGAAEFLDNYFTDQAFYRDNWKAGVAEVCLGQ
jgi:hypothetical protein